jgi:1-deoxy-D-xylulose-5-phosphate reductoisomerase
MDSLVSVSQICILGATGSIGLNTLDVIGRHPDRYRAHTLTANTNVEEMRVQCQRFKPQIAVMADFDSAQQLADKLKTVSPDTQVKSGLDSLCQAAEHKDIDTVMAAIVGAAGLEPTLAAVAEGKKILLANKESLVMAGELFMKEVARSGSVLLPIDSEHNAIFQCLAGQRAAGLNQDANNTDLAFVRRILLTASGGPFRTFTREQLLTVTPEQACAHPNWDMGRKISVDSATLMNKGLELIEACWLFGIKPENIEVHIHPESVVHSMVEYIDGSILAQMGAPDMRTPIAYGLAWPERIEAGVASLDLFSVARLNFERPDSVRFPCLSLAAQAFKAGGTAGAILNAANEIAVAAFLNRNMEFTAIPDTIAQVLASITPGPAATLEQILAADRAAREVARDLVRESPSRRS